jgi:hypothetical protein
MAKDKEIKISYDTSSDDSEFCHDNESHDMAKDMKCTIHHGTRKDFALVPVLRL